jgi:hypothetical protein
MAAAHFEDLPSSLLVDLVEDINSFMEGGAMSDMVRLRNLPFPLAFLGAWAEGVAAAMLGLRYSRAEALLFLESRLVFD